MCMTSETSSSLSVFIPLNKNSVLELLKCWFSLLFSLLDSSQEYTDSTGIDVHEFLVNTLKNNPRYEITTED